MNYKLLFPVIVSLLLSGCDSCGSCDNATLVIHNTVPVANAGADQNVFTGSVVILDGSGSSDADGNTITYSWTIVSTPAGSTVTTLPDSNIQQPSFTPDIDGTYVFQLIVNDGLINSNTDSVSIIAAACIVDRTYDINVHITYKCAFSQVNINISSFTMSASASLITPLPNHPGDLAGAASSCPAGSFSNVLVLPGACVETYTLVGTFTGPDTWSGTYTAEFAGACFDCLDQAYSVDALAR